MPVQLYAAAESDPADKLKVLLVGREKHGKSWLATTARPPVLIVDTDGRAEAILGRRPSVYVISLSDPPMPQAPTAAPAVVDIVAQLERDRDLAKLELRCGLDPSGKQIIAKLPCPAGTIVKTLVFDSITTLGRVFANYALFMNKSIRREVTIGNSAIHFPSGWDGWEAEARSVESLILRALAIPDLDVICTIHAVAEEAPDSTPETPRYTGRLDVYPNRYRRLVKYFNEVWLVKLMPASGGIMLPKVFTKPHSDFDCATSLQVDPVEEPDIGRILDKHYSRRGKNAQADSKQRVDRAS
jgi:hypothetical protein